ncbi:hypothetical protein [Piscirickettsia salmonis]|uniref:hypothetical protein n=1 Tax=Piscirickettsia salmonis TaxID=1238 RepID=UPI0007C89138|nr:hypothetical protein A0O36_01190 [Piscirickettsiaceae bacterium NZ-RLO1]
MNSIINFFNGQHQDHQKILTCLTSIKEDVINAVDREKLTIPPENQYEFSLIKTNELFLEKIRALNLFDNIEDHLSAYNNIVEWDPKPTESFSSPYLVAIQGAFLECCHESFKKKLNISKEHSKEILANKELYTAIMTVQQQSTAIEENYVAIKQIAANILRLHHLHSTQTAEKQTIINNYSATVFTLFGEYCSKKIDKSTCTAKIEQAKEQCYSKLCTVVRHSLFFFTYKTKNQRLEEALNALAEEDPILFP